MHRSANYLAGLFPAKAKKVVVESHVMTAVDVATVASAIRQDAGDYYYSACISILDGLRAIESGFYTWSTVKFYYSIYYALRAMLGWDGITVFWPGDAPYQVRIAD